MGTERTTFLINEQGIIEKIYRKVKVKGHAEICLLDLKK
jgi:peroxiredoxin Q/BCP